MSDATLSQALAIYKRYEDGLDDLHEEDEKCGGPLILGMGLIAGA